MRQTRSQTIAAAAYHCINERKNFAAVKKKKYKTLVLNLPAMIMQNGLTQTTGFLQAKGEEHQELLNDLCYVLQEVNTALKQQTLHENLLASDALQYMQLTRHALQAAGYLRRFTQGIFLDDSDNAPILGDAAEEQKA